MAYILDAIVLMIMLVSSYYGLVSGFIMSFTSFGGLVLSAWVSSQYIDDIYIWVVNFLKIDYFPVTISENYYIYIFAYVSMMLAIYSLIYLLGVILKGIFGALLLGWIDGILGAIFGFVKGIVFSMLFISIVIFLAKFSSSTRDLLNDSQIIKMLPDFSFWILDMLPNEVRERVLFYVNY